MLLSNTRTRSQKSSNHGNNSNLSFMSTESLCFWRVTEVLLLQRSVHSNISWYFLHLLPVCVPTVEETSNGASDTTVQGWEGSGGSQGIKMEQGRKNLSEIFISGTEREPLPLVAPDLCHCSTSSSSFCRRASAVFVPPSAPLVGRFTCRLDLSCTFLKTRDEKTKHTKKYDGCLKAERKSCGRKIFLF